MKNLTQILNDQLKDEIFFYEDEFLHSNNYNITIRIEDDKYIFYSTGYSKEFQSVEKIYNFILGWIEKLKIKY